MVHTDPGSIANSHNGDVAADSYHNYKQDVAALKETGVRTKLTIRDLRLIF